jgi:outer membrane protein assembly factor BamB
MVCRRFYPSPFVFFVSVVLVAPAPAADWPQFRGPAGDGHAAATNLPANWDDTTNVVWKTPIPGKGWSSPSLYRGKLYLTTADPLDPGSGSSKEISLRTLRIDAATGKIEWNVEVFRQGGDAPKIHTKNSHASPTALVEGDRIYVHFGHQGTACLDLAGKVIWKDATHFYPPTHGNGGSPVLEGGLLIFSCDGGKEPYVVALDATSGKEVWRMRRPADAVKKFSFSTPAVITVNGQRQLISPGSDVVSALDPATGREIWRVRYDGYSVIPRPLVGHGLIFLSTGYDSPVVMAIRPDGSGDVTETHVAWTLKKGGPHTPSLLLIGDELYMIADKGVATCVDAKTGEQHWQERIGGNYSSSPLFADGKIYLQSEEGPTYILKPGKTFEKPVETGIKERTLASYAVDDKALFIRTESNLFRIEQK